MVKNGTEIKINIKNQEQNEGGGGGEKRRVSGTGECAGFVQGRDPPYLSLPLSLYPLYIQGRDLYRMRETCRDVTRTGT